MAGTYAQTVYFGSGDAGRKIYESMSRRAKDLGFILKGEPNLSGYIMALIEKDLKREKQKVS